MINQTQTHMIQVQNIDVQVIRKGIKNLHLGVYPPNGHVRVAVPEHMNDDNVRLAIISKLAWIKKQQKEFQNQPRQSVRAYVSGECHYFFGKAYRLELIERMGSPEIEVCKAGHLKMYIKPEMQVEQKEKVLNEWYRSELKKVVPELLEKWAARVGKEASWNIRKMKTKWGSCNTDKNRILLNLELAKKPMECLEYILVHELVHLHERNHNERFKSLLETYLPNWKTSRKILNTAPLAFDKWEY